MARRLGVWLAATLAAAAGGCGTQQDVLGTSGSALLTAMDDLALPGETIELTARLQIGDLLRDAPGHIVCFYRDGTLWKAAQTDDEGVAAVSFVPPAAGDYSFTAAVSPTGLNEAPPQPRTLLIACRAAEAPMVVVDLDKTLVASGFETVLIGSPQPMAGSQEVLQRLAGTHTIVYLTHRPDYFGPKSKAWLVEHRYPQGPVLLSRMGEFLAGSGEYKTQALARLTARFHNIRIGIGDKVSDAMAYHRNGLKAFAIVPVEGRTEDAAGLEALADELKALPPAVQVVTGWDQIEQALFAGASYPPAGVERRLRELAEARRRQGAATQQTDPQL